MILQSDFQRGRYNIAVLSGATVADELQYSTIWDAKNGLQRNGRTVVLGGNLTGNTTILLGNKVLSFASNRTDVSFADNEISISNDDGTNEEGSNYSTLSLNADDGLSFENRYEGGLYNLQIGADSGSVFNHSKGSKITTGFVGIDKLEFKRSSSSPAEYGTVSVDDSYRPFLESSHSNFGIARFSVDAEGTFFSDTNEDARGIRYSSNFSSNFVARSLVDAGFVTGLTYLTASNGITKVGKNLVLGGSLTNDTTLSLGDKTIYFQGNGDSADELQVSLSSDQIEFKIEVGEIGYGRLHIYDASKILLESAKLEYDGLKFARLSINAVSGTTFTDTNATTRGIQYAGDYSGNFVARSLVDAGFVTGHTSTELIDRRNVAFSSNVTLNLSSKEQNRFVLTGATSGNTTLTFSNTGNVEFFTVDISGSSTVNLTMPSSVRMQQYEVDAGRWNSSTKVLSLIAGSYQLTFAYDGTIYKLNTSDRYV